jgi:hypothetical protein
MDHRPVAIPARHEAKKPLFKSAGFTRVHSSSGMAFAFIPQNPSTQQEHSMPMRGELVVPIRHSQADREVSQSGVFPVVCFCIIGLLVTLCFALSKPAFDQLPLLVAHYNIAG